MSSVPGSQLDIELLAPMGTGAPEPAGFCVGRVVRADADASGFVVGDILLAPVHDAGQSTLRVPAACCVALPADMPPATALAVLPLTLALWIWDVAGLEPGEIAVYTSDSMLDRPLAAVAGWRSARDAIRLDSFAEPERASAELSAAMRSAPGAVAAVMTAKTAALDVIFEAMPMWGRIVLAAATSDPATIDFYNNVHRKGCRMLSVPGTPAQILDPFWIRAAAAHVARAARILQNDRLARACLT